jgi:hypothetical protein
LTGEQEQKAIRELAAQLRELRGQPAPGDISRQK